MAIDRTRTGAAAPARPKLSNAIQTVKQGTARLVADTLKLSTGEKLKEGNKRAVKHAAQTLEGTVTHPLDTLRNTVRGMVDLIVHPEKALGGIAEKFRKDPVDGAIATANAGAAYAGIGAIALTAGAWLAAPFTAGTSLGLLPVAATLGSAAGAVGLGAAGASILKNQADIASAKTEADLERESRELGEDVAGVGMDALMAGAGKGLQKAAQQWKPKNINPSSMQRAADAGADIVKKKLGAGKNIPHGGIDVEGLSPEQVHAKGLQEVQKALDWSVQGERALEVRAVNRGSFEGLSNVGERKLVFHGTREDVKELIRANGLKSSSIGDFGSGVYLATSAKTGLVYADDVTFARSASNSQHPTLYSVEIATGKVLDFHAEKDAFVKWAKARFNPTDLKDPVNQLYANPEVPVNPFVDNTWNRFLPRYMKEMGYDSILIRDAEGLGKDFWVVQDPKRIILRQEFSVAAPTNRELLPSSLNRAVAENLTPPEEKREQE